MPSRVKAVHQFLPSISYGDAISNHVRAIQAFFRAQDYQSEIFAENISKNLKQSVLPYDSYKGDAHALVVYHLSIGSAVSEFVRRLPGTRVVIYHNITPSHYFKSFNPELARLLQFGRQELRMLMPGTALGLGDSAYNEQELKTVGYPKTGVLPIIIDMAKFNGVRNEALYERFDDDWTNLLFVGRISPNKRVCDLIRTFHAYSLLNPKSRLFLIGSWLGMEQYKEEVDALVARLDVGNVYWTGTVDLDDLATYYQLADVFVSMSEHEGFMVPLVESMHFGVPIIAYASSAVPETLGRGGLLVDTKDYEVLAGLIDRVVTDTTLRDQIISYQKEELLRFAPAQTVKKLQTYLSPFLTSSK